MLRRTEQDVADDRRARRLVARRRPRAERRVPARADGRRGPALPPLHVGHHRRSPRASCTRPAATSRRSRTRTSTCSTSSPTPTSTGAPPTSAGSPATRTSSTGRSRTATTSVIYEGTPDYPDKDRLWSIVEKYGVTILYTAPTAIRTFMKWGDGVPGAARPVVAAAARHRRRADQPRGVGLVLAAHRRRALPGRRHVVADRDRRHHDQPAAGRDDAEAGQRDVPAARASAPTSSTTTGDPVGDPRRRLPRAHAAVAVDAARHLGRPGALPRHLLVALRRPVLRRRRRQARRRRLLLAARPRRRHHARRPGHNISTTEVESALVDHPAVAEAAVVGKTDDDDRAGDRARS